MKKILAVLAVAAISGCVHAGPPGYYLKTWSSGYTETEGTVSDLHKTIMRMDTLEECDNATVFFADNAVTQMEKMAESRGDFFVDRAEFTPLPNAMEVMVYVSTKKEEGQARFLFFCSTTP